MVGNSALGRLHVSANERLLCVIGQKAPSNTAAKPDSERQGNFERVLPVFL